MWDSCREICPHKMLRFVRAVREFLITERMKSTDTKPAVYQCGEGLAKPYGKI